jgi:MFS family permease
VSPLFAWWRAADAPARRAFVASSLGWMLDSFDVMLYALALRSIMPDLGMTARVAGLIASATLVTAAGGGIAFGLVADRHGRTRALMASVLIYAVFTAACGLAQTVVQLAVFRVLLGIGMGGEWASGATLVSEVWPAEHRGKALAFMQSAWAIGYGLAALVTALVMPRWGWRVLFGVGLLPAFFTIWIRRRVEEPALWIAARTRREPHSRFRDVFSPGLRGLTLAVTTMNALTLFAWWGFNLWLPGYLSQPLAAGGVGLSTRRMAMFVFAMQIGMWFGYVSFGFISDRVGRRRTYVAYLVAAAVLIAAYVSIRAPLALFVLGPVVAFFSTGYFSGFGAVTAEIYPTAIRGTAQGFTYNAGRLASAGAPFAVGSLATTHGFRSALLLTSGAFVLAALTWIFIPETRGRALA